MLNKDKAAKIKAELAAAVDAALIQLDVSKIETDLTTRIQTLLSDTIKTKLGIRTDYGRATIDTASPLACQLNAAVAAVKSSLVFTPPVLTPKELRIIKMEYDRAYKAAVKKEIQENARTIAKADIQGVLALIGSDDDSET